MRPTIPFGKQMEWQVLLSPDNASLRVMPDTTRATLQPPILDLSLRDRKPDEGPQALQSPRPKTESPSLVHVADASHDPGLLSLAHLKRYICKLWGRGPGGE